MEWRKDPFPKILFVVGGEGALHWNRKEFALRAISLIVVPAGTSHRLTDAPGNPISLYGICFGKSSFPSRSLVEAACSRCRLETGTVLAIGASKALKAIMIEERNERPESEDLQLSYVCQLLASLTRNPFDEEPSDEALRSRARVEAYVERLASSFWKTEDLDSVARSLGLSRRRFTQIFREVTGESWLARVTRLRMEHARHLLTETHLSVRSICFECGFAEISSFYRLFRSTYRTSPGAFRKQAGERR